MFGRYKNTETKKKMFVCITEDSFTFQNKYYHRACEQRKQAAVARAGDEPCSK